jgi:hypothetical protein
MIAKDNVEAPVEYLLLNRKKLAQGLASDVPKNHACMYW